MHDLERKWFTPQQVMVRYELSKSTVYGELKDGTIPSVRISRRKILIPENALELQLQKA